MSSESEDEFQSADEGSDSENSEYIPKALAQPTPPCMNASLSKKVDKVRKDETYNVMAMDKYDKDSSPLKEVPIVDNTKADVLCGSHEESISQTMSELSVVDNETEGGRASDQLDSKYSVPEVKEIADMNVERLEDESVTQECMQKGGGDYHLEEHKNAEIGQVQPKEMVRNNVETEELKEKHEDSRGESEVSSTNTATIDTKPESVDDGSGIHGGRKPKAIRQSKIGMKKPREKLGERLGAKKINVNMANISTDSTSCVNTTRGMEEESGKMLSSNQKKLRAEVVSKSTDSTSSVDTKGPMEEESDEVQTKNTRCTMTGKGAGETEEDEKSKKRQQWEEQQERWHQALNLGKSEKEASSRDSDGWGAPWGGWGSTLLSAATTLTREVGRGVGTVMETVESSIGAPSPEVMAQELAKQEQPEKKLEEKSAVSSTEESEEADKENHGDSKESSVGGWQSGQQRGASYGLGGFSLGSLVSGVSGALETASSKVLMGGLDTLEVIGRKAMDVIQEGDPGLRRKRAFLSNKKPNLSQMLQEARQRASEEEKERAIDGRSAKNSQKPSFEQAWEDSEGPVHLEALSLVAKQCQSKKTSMAATLPHYVQDKLHSNNTVIKNTCELDEEGQVDGDLVEVVPVVLAKIDLPLHPQKLIEAWSLVQEKAALIQEADLEKRDQAENELYQALAKFVTQLCALAHKGGELALITPEIDPLDVASHFKDLAQVVSGSLENMADQVCGSITSGADAADAQIKDTITNIYLQAATCNNYIQQSLVSLASILQYSNTKLAAAQL